MFLCGQSSNFLLNVKAIHPDEIESAKKNGLPLEMLLPKSEEEELYPAAQVPVQMSMNYEENSVTHSENYSVETSIVSPMMPNKYVN